MYIDIYMYIESRILKESQHLARDNLRIFNIFRNNVTNTFVVYKDNRIINHVTLPDGLYPHLLYTST